MVTLTKQPSRGLPWGQSTSRRTTGAVKIEGWISRVLSLDQARTPASWIGNSSVGSEAGSTLRLLNRKRLQEGNGSLRLAHHPICRCSTEQTRSEPSPRSGIRHRSAQIIRTWAGSHPSLQSPTAARSRLGLLQLPDMARSTWRACQSSSVEVPISSPRASLSKASSRAVGSNLASNRLATIRSKRPRQWAWLRSQPPWRVEPRISCSLLHQWPLRQVASPETRTPTLRTCSLLTEMTISQLTQMKHIILRIKLRARTCSTWRNQWDLRFQIGRSTAWARSHSPMPM